MDIKDAVGEVIASFMKHDTLEHYRRERALFTSTNPVDRRALSYTGQNEGCIAEAEEFIARLEKRGWRLAPVKQEPSNGN